MPQKLGPWEDAVTREAYQKIIDIVREFRKGDDGTYMDAEEAMQDIEDAIGETEGDEVW
jgi:hypothetical protein